MSGSRDAILGRVREALSVPSDPHVRRAPQRQAPDGEYREWLPPVEEDFASRTALFAEYSEKLKTEFVVVPDADAANAAVAKLAADNGWTRIAYHGAALPEAAASASGIDTLNVDGGYDTQELEQCNAGVTGCDALIAQTGSVLITTRSAGGRALSVLPEHHIVLATREQLVSDMAAGYAVLRDRYGNDWPSFISFITGPSRTGDIERILVLGAHGPKRLTVILIETPG